MCMYIYCIYETYVYTCICTHIYIYIWRSCSINKSTIPMSIGVFWVSLNFMVIFRGRTPFENDLFQEGVSHQRGKDCVVQKRNSFLTGDGPLSGVAQQSHFGFKTSGDPNLMIDSSIVCILTLQSLPIRLQSS